MDTVELGNSRFVPRLTIMSTLEEGPVCPRLRPGLVAAPDGDPRHVYIQDRLRITREPLRLTHVEFQWARLINGKRSPRDLQAEAMRLASGLLTPLDQIEDLLRRLDEALFLDNQRFRDYLHGPEREPSCIGCYAAEPDLMRQQLGALFTLPGASGPPGEPGCRTASEGRIRAVLAPHIDYARGGASYSWPFKEVVERTDASLFVIIATSHYSPERFTLTRKNFKTPLGTVPTDQGYVDHLERLYGDGLFEDPIAHLPEHSIELEVAMLQYVFEGKRPFRIVPLLVGSFHDCVATGTEPGEREDIQRMVAALRQVEAELAEPVCYIISGDLAHIGPKFDDPDPVGEPFLSESLKQDHAILQQAEQVNARGYFEMIAAEGDRRRICGLPPTWTTLAAVQPQRSRLLHYGRYVHPRGHESVSFASMVFE
jgi:MEMO1 family protein